MDPDAIAQRVGIPVLRVALGEDVDPMRNAAVKAAFEQELTREDADPMVVSMLAAVYEQEGNYEAALRLLERAIAESPEDYRHAPMLGHANVLLNSGDVTGALAEYDALLAYVETQPLRDRDLRLPAMCAGMLRTHAPERALDWVESGLRVLLQIGGELDDARWLYHEYRSLAASCEGRTVNQELAARADRYLNAVASGGDSTGRNHAILGYFPAEAFDDHSYREVLAVAGLDNAETQRLTIERCLRTRISPTLEKYIATIDMPGLRDCARRHHIEATSPAAMKLYAAELTHAGHGFRWPPERNAPCWCGTGVKYKKCCGRPTLLTPEEEAMLSYQERTGEGWSYP